MSTKTMIGTGMLAAATLWTSVACAQTDGDAGIKPGDDFFAYANGDWLRATEIPAGKERWSARNEIDDLTRQQTSGADRRCDGSARGIRCAQGRRFPRGLPEREPPSRREASRPSSRCSTASTAFATSRH